MASDWSSFWYDDPTQEIFFNPPCKHEPLDIGFPSRTVWCRSCSVCLKLEDGKWVTK